MYLRVMSSRMTSRLVFELEEDENGKLNEIEEQERLGEPLYDYS